MAEKILTELLVAINKVAWPMLDDKIDPIFICERVIELAEAAAEFINDSKEIPT